MVFLKRFTWWGRFGWAEYLSEDTSYHHGKQRKAGQRRKGILRLDTSSTMETGLNRLVWSFSAYFAFSYRIGEAKTQYQQTFLLKKI